MNDDDRTEELLETVRREYHDPPPTPRDEIWARITEARRQPNRGQAEIIDLASRRPPNRWLRGGLALAAMLMLGVAVGRWALPELRSSGGTASTVTTTTPPEHDAARSATVLRYAAVEHLSQVNALLTDYQTGRMADELPGTARSLLSRTRLLMDAPDLDPTMRALFEDLEMLLVQVAQLAPDRLGEDRELIDDNLAERAIRARLRNAIPAGPAA